MATIAPAGTVTSTRDEPAATVATAPSRRTSAAPFTENAEPAATVTRPLTADTRTEAGGPSAVGVGAVTGPTVEGDGGRR